MFILLVCSIVVVLVSSHSLGIIVWELYCEKRPYLNVGNPYQIMFKVVNEELRPEIPAHCPLGTFSDLIYPDCLLLILSSLSIDLPMYNVEHSR